ncbi:MAG: WbqC family protein [bacterium]|jgi:hypothetical protein
MMTRIGQVAIHQPNFFPWLGYFDKIRRSDAFVFLDEVAYARAGSGSMGSWTNRVRIAIQGEPRWITCPIRRMPLGSLISAARIDDGQPWREKLLRTLELNYRRAPNFGTAMALLVPLIEYRDENLAAYNMGVIQAISGHLGIGARFLRQSEVEYSGNATDLLISLVRAAGGESYLAGGGASGYQEDAKFAEAGVGLVMQHFVPRCYGESKSFLPGLSVIDYLMRDGRRLTEAFPGDQS